MSSVIYRPDATNDLFGIWLYIAEASHSTDVADRVINALDAKCKTIASQPLTGELCPELAPDIRCFSSGSYIVLYLPTSTGIDVVQVIHGARDLPNRFRPP